MPRTDGRASAGDAQKLRRLQQMRDNADRLLHLDLVPVALEPHSKKPVSAAWQTAPAGQAAQLLSWMSNLGLRCDGLVVIDEDSPLAGKYWADRLGEVYEVTTAIRSPGGLKRVFRVGGGFDAQGWSWHGHGDGIEFDVLVGPGHQVVIPPSIHPDGPVYEWVIGLDALVRLTEQQAGTCRKHSLEGPPEGSGAAEKTSAGAGTRQWSAVSSLYAERALRDELDAVSGTTKGRNNQLNESAFKLGRLIGAGQLDEARVKEELQGAAEACGLTRDDGQQQVDATIASGMSKGKLDPRDPPKDKPRPATNPTGGRNELTDMGNARRLAEAHGDDLKYSAHHGWLVWDGRHWARDLMGEVDSRIKHTMRAINTEAAIEEDTKIQGQIAQWARQSQSAGRVAATAQLGKSEPEIVIHPSRLDQDPWLFPAADRTIDLRTGQAREHDRRDYITAATPVRCVDGGATPRWDAFLRRVCQDPVGQRDSQLERYLQQIAGYTLTGDTSEQCLFFLHGGGKNGKTTFIEVLRRIMGEYAVTLDPEVLMAQGRGQAVHASQLAILQGKRMAVCAETETGRRLAESRVKQLTGGDAINAKRLYQEPFEFLPQFKIWMYGNAEPVIRGTDEGIWRRIKKVPFDAYIPAAEQVPKYEDVLLREEGPGILAWAVAGCADWCADGLVEPDRVKASTQQYRSEQDSAGDFLNTRVGFDKEASIGYREYQIAYARWAIDYGVSQRIPNRKLIDHLIAYAQQQGVSLRKSAGPVGRGKDKDRRVYGVYLLDNHQFTMGSE